MEQTRLPRTRALIEVPRILMQNRGQKCPAHKDVGQTVCVNGPETLPIALDPFFVVGITGCLVDGCEKSSTRKGHRVGRNLEGQSVFKPGREWRRILVVADVEVRNEAQNSLLLLDPDLFGG